MSFVTYKNLVQILSTEPAMPFDGAMAWQANMKSLADAIYTLQQSGGVGGSSTELSLTDTDATDTLVWSFDSDTDEWVATTGGSDSHFRFDPLGQLTTFMGDVTIQTTADEDKPFLNLWNDGAGGKRFNIGSTNNESCEGAGLLSIYNATDGGWPMRLDGAGNVRFSGVMQDGSSNASVDPNNRQLFDGDGSTVVIDWTMSQNNSAMLSWDGHSDAFFYNNVFVGSGLTGVVVYRSNSFVGAAGTTNASGFGNTAVG